MSTNDEREAQDSAALTAARAIYGNSFDPAVHVVQFDTMRQAARAILASLPAPTPAAETTTINLNITEDEARDLNRVARWERESAKALGRDDPAAGEAVAWMFTSNVSGRITFGKSLRDCPRNWKAAPLYAAPHPPEQCANIAQKSEQAPGTGGDAVEVAREAWASELDKMGLQYRANDVRRGDYQYSWDERTVSAILVALANHSPDAGGVGE